MLFFLVLCLGIIGISNGNKGRLGTDPGFHQILPLIKLDVPTGIRRHHDHGFAFLAEDHSKNIIACFVSLLFISTLRKRFCICFKIKQNKQNTLKVGHCQNCPNCYIGYFKPLWTMMTIITMILIYSSLRETKYWGLKDSWLS